jgi:plasmid stabilization system protein ParE
VKVIWTEPADARLARIEAFVAEHNPAAAARLAERLVARSETLDRFPNRGRPVPEYPESDLRELIEGNYRIVYQVRGDTVEIVTVFEGHRQFPEEDLR